MVALAGVIVLALVGLVSGFGAGPVWDGFAGEQAPAAPTPVVGADSVLLAWPSGDGQAVIALVGTDAAGESAGVLLIPSHTQVEVPSLGSDTLGRALDVAGGDALSLTLQNTLGVSVGTVVAVDRDELAALLRPVSSFPVELRRPVVTEEASYRAGPQTITASEAVELLTRDDDNDLDHLVLVHSVLEGWFSALDDDGLRATREAFRSTLGLGETEVTRAVRVLSAASGPGTRFDTLRTESLGVPGEERYAVREDQVREDLDEMFPGLRLGEAGVRPRIEILNGTGEPGLATEVAKLLVPEGFRVVLTGNAGQFDVRETVVVLQDGGTRELAETVVGLLGTGTVRAARTPVGVVELSIVVGEDFEPGGG